MKAPARAKPTTDQEAPALPVFRIAYADGQTPREPRRFWPFRRHDA